MAEVLLFHHIQGLTEGVQAFADDLRAGGHTVHTPDLYGGTTFGSIEEGFEFQKGVDGDALRRRGRRRICPPAWSTPASPGACCRRSGWPRRAPARRARCSTSRASRSPASGPSDRGPRACRCRSTAWTRTSSSPRRATSTPPARSSQTLGPDLAELYTYPGDAHLFADRTLASYDADAAALLTERTWRSSTASRSRAVRETARHGPSPARGRRRRHRRAAGGGRALAVHGRRPLRGRRRGDGDRARGAVGAAFLPTGDALVGERTTGGIYEIPAEGGEPDALVGTVPGRRGASARAGCSGIAVDPLFIHDSFVYAYLTTATDNRIVRFRLVPGRARGSTTSRWWSRASPRRATTTAARWRSGPTACCTPASATPGNPDRAQDPDSLNGKILRMDPLGNPPSTTPTPTRTRWCGRWGTATCRGWRGTTTAGCGRRSSGRTPSTRST